jgi:hypothetical protein
VVNASGFSSLLEKALRIRAGLFSFMASSLLERPWREKELSEQSEPRLCLVKHPHMALARLKAEQHYPKTVIHPTDFLQSITSTCAMERKNQ